MNYAINLLPPHLRPQRGLQTKHLLWGAVIAVVSAIGVLHGLYLYKISQVEREILQVQQQIEILAPNIEKVKINEQIQQNINTRYNIIAQISREMPLKWSEVVLQLGQSTPNNLWLKEIASEAYGIVSIKGETPDIAIVTQYVNNLSEHANFEQVTFMGLEQKDLNGKYNGLRPPLNIVTYELSLKVRGGEKE